MTYDTPKAVEMTPESRLLQSTQKYREVTSQIERLHSQLKELSDVQSALQSEIYRAWNEISNMVPTPAEANQPLTLMREGRY